MKKENIYFVIEKRKAEMYNKDNENRNDKDNRYLWQRVHSFDKNQQKYLKNETKILKNYEWQL